LVGKTGEHNMPTAYDRGQFGVTGGYWGGGQDLSSSLKNVLDRLLSPDEFAKLDNAVRSAYGGYMGYLNAFAKTKKFKQQGADAYRAVQSGTYEPFDMGVSYGGAQTSTRGRIPAAGAKGEPARIPTTIHRDIYGKPTEELAGGGVYRGMGGETIPQTAEQYGQQLTLNRAIPAAELESDIDFLSKVARKTQLESEIALPKREEAAIKLQQAQQRIAQGDVRLQQYQQRLDDINANLAKTLTHREYMVAVQKEAKKELMGIANDFKAGEAGLNREWRENVERLKGAFPGTPEAAQRQQEILGRQLKLIDAKAAIDKTAEARKYTYELKKQAIAYSYWLDKQPFLTSRQKEAEEKRTQATQQTPPVAGTSVQEVRRNVNGKIAIFDAATKQFIRWE